MKPGLEKYLLLVENLPDGFAYHQIVTDTAGKPVDYFFLEVNPAFEDMTGLSDQKIRGKRVTEALPGIENSKFDWIGTYGNVALTGAPTRFEQFFEPLDRWYEVTAYSDEPGFFVTLFRDVTDVKKKEILLQEKDAINNEIQHIAKLGRWELDLRSNHLQWSWTIYEIFEMDPAGFEATYEAFLETVHPEDREKVNQAYNRSLVDRQPYSIEHRLLMKDGRIKWVNELCRTEYDSQGQAIRSVGIVQDITERKQVEEALRKSEEDLSITLNSIGDGVIATDEHGLIVRMNPVAERLCGWPFAEAKGKPLKDIFRIIHTETRKPAADPVALVMEKGEVVGLANHTSLLSRDGREYQIADSAAPITNKEGLILGVVLVFSDITEDYALRKNLQESRNLLQGVFNSIQDGISVVGKDLTIKTVNKSMEEWYSHAKPLAGKKCYAVYQNRTEPCRPCSSIKAMESKEMCVEMVPLMAEEKQVGWLELFSYPLMDSSGDVVGVVEFVRDITARRQAEQKLADHTRELERLYRELDQEMDKARQVHERTLPKSLPQVEGISFAAYYQPAQKLGGDLYDIIQKDSKLIFYLSDVSGHGLDGAMLSVFVKHTIKGYLSFMPEDSINPAEAIRYLAEQFTRENYPEEYFICIFLCVLDLETMELTYSGAGFQDRPLVRMNCGEHVRLSSKGLFISPNLPVEMLNYQDSRIHLTPGSTLLFNTDGLSEQASNGAYYMERLPAVFHQNAHLSPQLIVEAVCQDFKTFNQGSLQGDDDFSFLVLQVNSNNKRTHRLVFSSRLDELENFYKELDDLLPGFEDVGTFTTCLHELFANALEHGNRLDQNKSVFVEITVADSYMQAIVEDQGEGFNWQESIDRPLDLEGNQERGRGIAMTRLCCDKLFYNEKGNQVTVIILR